MLSMRMLLLRAFALLALAMLYCLPATNATTPTTTATTSTTTTTAVTTTTTGDTTATEPGQSLLHKTLGSRTSDGQIIIVLPINLLGLANRLRTIGSVYAMMTRLRALPGGRYYYYYYY
jgi:hypothetical protein